MAKGKKAKSAKNSFSEKEGLYRSLVEKFPEPILLMDSTGNIIVSNKKISELIGYTAEELRGKNSFNLTAPEDKQYASEALKNIINQGSILNFEYTLVSKDGIRIPVEASASLITDSNGKPKAIIATARDISRRRELNKKINQSQKILAFGQLASNVADEFNNPIGIIIGFANSLMSMVKDNETSLKAVEAIQREAIRCNDLIQDLKCMSGINENRRTTVNINRLIDDAIYFIDTRLNRKAINIKKEYIEELPRIIVNYIQLRQAIINICDNAIDASDIDDTITIRTNKVTINNKDFLEVQIEDEGKGIPKEIQHKIFEPFFTTDTSGKKITGLGLSLAKEVVQMHYGFIDIQSDEGKGTLVTIFLSLEDTPTEIIKRKKVLVVDDQLPILKLIESTVKDMNLELMFAKDGFEAGKIVSDKAPDLIILDIYLPRLNGFEVCNIVKRDVKLRDIKILAISGVNIKETRTKILKAGADDFMGKPFSLDDIKQKIMELLYPKPETQ